MAKIPTDCLAQIRATVGAVTGIRSAPDTIPENAGGIYPFFVAWIGPGTVRRLNAGDVVFLFSVIGQVHFGRGSLPQAADYAGPFLRSISLALLTDPTLKDSNSAATCDKFGDIEHSGLQPMMWGDTPTIGFQFTLSDFKILEASAAT